MNLFKISGLQVQYYVYCERRCWLNMRRVNLENNSDHVKVGRAQHEKLETDEVMLEGICVDKITGEFVIEYKKSFSNIEVSKYQLMYYLLKLQEKGLCRKGKLVHSSTGEEKIVILSEQNKIELNDIIKKIDELNQLSKPPKYRHSPKCNNCSYFSYCSL
jgi:CRISPR-associated exonuclease Cas4